MTDQVSRRQRILKVAHALFEEQKKMGAIAVLSPTPQDLIDIIVSSIILSDSYNTIIDVGCGDGRWLLGWATVNPLAFGYGIDIEESKVMTAKSLLNACSKDVQNRIEFVLCDYCQFNFCLTNVVVVYLSRFGNEKIKAKILSECHRGTSIVAIGVCSNILFPKYSLLISFCMFM